MFCSVNTIHRWVNANGLFLHARICSLSLLDLIKVHVMMCYGQGHLKVGLSSAM